MYPRFKKKYHPALPLTPLLSLCLALCLSVGLNISRLKSWRHETWHVGPQGTLECLRLRRFLKFDLKV